MWSTASVSCWSNCLTMDFNWPLYFFFWLPTDLYTSSSDYTPSSDYRLHMCYLSVFPVRSVKVMLLWHSNYVSDLSTLTIQRLWYLHSVVYLHTPSFYAWHQRWSVGIERGMFPLCIESKFNSCIKGWTDRL